MDLFHSSSVSTVQLDKERLPREGVSTRHGIVLPPAAVSPGIWQLLNRIPSVLISHHFCVIF